MGKNNLFSNASVEFMNDKLKAPAGISGYYLNPASLKRDTIGNAVLNNLYRKYHESDFVTLKDVTVLTKAKTHLQRLDSMYASPLFQQGNVKNFDVRNDPSFYGGMDILRYLEFRVPGLQVYYTNIVGEIPLVLYRGFRPDFFIDEIPVDTSDISRIRNLNVSDIAMLKVIPPPFIGTGGNGPGGAIAIYMKRPDDREFDDKKKDWNSGITTTSLQQEVKLKFYNNDFTKSFRIIVEGMNANGQFTHFEKLVQ